MSEYGRLWQQAADLRAEIQRELLRPLPHNYKPADVQNKSKTLERLATRWEVLEEMMRKTDG